MLDAVEVLKVFERHRGDAIVTAQGTAGRNWVDVSNNEKRDISLGGAMG